MYQKVMVNVVYHATIAPTIVDHGHDYHARYYMFNFYTYVASGRHVNYLDGSCGSHGMGFMVSRQTCMSWVMGFQQKQNPYKLCYSPFSAGHARLVESFQNYIQITLLNNTGPRNITVGYWKFNNVVMRKKVYSTLSFNS